MLIGERSTALFKAGEEPATEWSPVASVEQDDRPGLIEVSGQRQGLAGRGRQRKGRKLVSGSE